ncbi:MAG: hypothetical protein HY064_00570 [Bacteroidetes bacterium]|nr:hypothetical protein [Bacteroidota bacterium]
MKRLFTIFAIFLTAFAFAQTQETKKGKSKSKKSNAEQKESPAPGSSNSSGGITIDEGGQSRPTYQNDQKTTDSAAVNPKNASGGGSGAGSITIDEPGQQQPDKSKSGSANSAPKADSASTVPTEELGRPKRFRRSGN